MEKRCFISFDIDNEKLVQKLKKIQENLSKCGQNSLTKPENFHITVNFIGDTDEKEISEIKSSLDKVKAEKFTASVKGLGAFPDEDYIKVVWAGIGEKRGKTQKISEEIRERIPEKHVQKDDFHPHITLMRLKNIEYEEKQKLKEFLDKYKGEKFGETQISEVKMKVSHLTEKGAKHRTIYKKDLK